MYKQIIFSLFLITIYSCQLAPCLTKDSFVSASISVAEKFGKDHKTFTDNQWKSMDDQYKNFLGNCYTKHVESMSSDEKKKFWLNTSQYFIKRGYKGPDMSKELQDLYTVGLEKYLEAEGSRFAEKFKEIINVNIDDAVDKVFDLLKKWGGDKK